MGINQGPISLDQKYTQESGHIFLTGIQALVRLPMAQIRRDRAAGLNTAGFVSGYRGSPLGGYDQQLFAARKHLEQYDVKFQPGVNEDLAATAVWGSQQLNLSPGARHDGVVGQQSAIESADIKPAAAEATTPAPPKPAPQMIRIEGLDDGPREVRLKPEQP